MPRLLLAFIGLVTLALTAYAPALGGDFLWDDIEWVRDNENLRTWRGLLRIWFEPGAVIQYYPLTYTTWWIDSWLWDLSPVALHVENVLLHAGNALLFGTLLRRLGLRGASLAAVVFLLHPVHTESVAWIVERKNTLSTAFYLGAAHAWLSHVDDRSGRSLAQALLLFAGALLAKTATLMLPVTLLLIAIWRSPEWRATLRSLTPFVVMSLLAAAMTIFMERGEGAVGHDWALTLPDRLALVGQILGFYLGKFLLPISLSFVYAKWDIGAASVWSWLPTLTIGIALLLTLRARRRAWIAAAIALWSFGANLLPVSGLVDFYYLRYAFAADHFQYLPSLGPIALLCCGGAWLLRAANPRITLAIAVVLACVLGYGTWQRSHTFSDLESLWRTTIATEPNAWLAHTNLGVLLARRGNPDEGIEHHRRAVAIYANAFESNNALGNHCARQGDFAAARKHFDHALAVRPGDPLTFNNLGAMAGIQGDLQAALRWFEQGHRLAPTNRDLMRNLAMLLANAPDPTLRNGPRALQLARRLNDIDEPSTHDQLALFRAMLLAGDREEAIALGHAVLTQAEQERQPVIAQQVARQLQQLGQ